MTATDEASHVSTGLRRVLESSAIYSLFQRLVGADRLRRHFVERFVRPFPGARILDVGCGTAVILDYLPEGVDYLGLDLNPRYVAAAEKRYPGRGRFLCSRVGELDSLAQSRQTFDVVLAMAILHHLDDPAAAKLILDASRHLAPGGVFASLDGCYHPGQSRAARFLLANDRGRHVRAPAGYRGLFPGDLKPDLTEVETRLYRIPYSLFLVRAVKVPAY